MYDISYDPFDYVSRLSGTLVDGVYDQSMTGTKGSEVTDKMGDHPDTMEFYEMTCGGMLISRASGPLEIERRAHVQATFVEFPLSDDGIRATHALEAFISGDVG